MSEKTEKKKTIANAIIWAAMILATSMIVGDSDKMSAMLPILIAGWFASNMMLAGKDGMQKECAMWRKLLGIQKSTD
ncbi:MAG: hypothetical protein JJ850_16505 [Kordiimonadaceae bacterium]|nr:hypothetical protein [Kordiimonadaceae bacterium]MBO6569691.1 hypothetical protein [Kordiimonadaceae bacterium]MBO6966226.1 hypothetical protein [Kordiimonadaceae bacterium]